MAWHTIPRDDAWKQVTLAHVDALGRGIWIHCHCGRQKIVGPGAFAIELRLPMTTPLLSIALRMRCTACGEKKVQVWPEPYSMPSAMG